ncbi:EamA family transporter [Streptomyces sp. SID5785]|uniref:DMT family transporter n=1 Tax=Streptomyces sp. SID5785 TaxID=2690309 RepID=UPI001361C957|nr:EamA family transporter [Streptomyces sp. SID5785]MZD04527.1 EamA family transporter [Streptomyces sp. SID5785]
MPACSSLSPRRVARTGPGLFVVAGLLWGTGGLAGSFLASRTGLPPASVAAYRLLVGGALITSFTRHPAALGSALRAPGAPARLASTGVLMAVYQTAYFAAVQATSVSMATLTTMVAIPVLVTVGSTVLDRRRPTFRSVGSVVTAVCGLVLLLDSPVGADTRRAEGAGLALLAALGFSVLTLQRRTAPPGPERDPTIGLGFLAGGVLLLPAGLASGMQLPLRADAFGAVLFLGLVPTALAYSSYFAGLHRAGAGAGVVAVLLEPLTATLLAVLLGRDRLNGVQILGAALTLFSIGIQQARTRDTCDL